MIFLKKSRKIIKYLTLFFFLSITVFFLYSLILVKQDKENNLITKYLEIKFSSLPSEGIIEIFKQIPDAKYGEKIIIIGSEMDSKILSLPLEKKYQVLGLDTKLIWYETLIPNYEKYHDQIEILNDWQVNDLPKAKIIMANYALNFFDKDNFEETWRILEKKLEVGGYFIGSFLSKNSTIFSEKYRKNISFFDENQLKELLQNYKIIYLKKNKNYLIEMNGEEVYYQVFAVKIK